MREAAHRPKLHVKMQNMQYLQWATYFFGLTPTKSRADNFRLLIFCVTIAILFVAGLRNKKFLGKIDSLWSTSQIYGLQETNSCSSSCSLLSFQTEEVVRIRYHLYFIFNPCTEKKTSDKRSLWWQTCSGLSLGNEISCFWPTCKKVSIWHRAHVDDLCS